MGNPNCTVCALAKGDGDMIAAVLSIDPVMYFDKKKFDPWAARIKRTLDGARESFTTEIIEAAWKKFDDICENCRRSHKKIKG